MKKRSFVACMLAALAVVVVGCRKDPIKNLSPEESRIYITNHDSTASFAAFSTFSIADSVGVVEDNRGLGKELSSYDAAIIEAVKLAMQDRGYTLVARDQSPDIGITVSRVYNNYTGLISYPSYWDFYGGFYDPFYWGYGGFNYFNPIYYGPNFYTSYQITQGAVMVDMLNLRDAKDDNTIRPVWSGIARGEGVFGTGNAPAIARALFEQSPYLSK